MQVLFYIKILTQALKTGKQKTYDILHTTRRSYVGGRISKRNIDFDILLIKSFVSVEVVWCNLFIVG